MQNLKIDYVEFQTNAIKQSKTFFTQAFGWDYIDYGPEYADIQNAGLGGGLNGSLESGALPPLVVLKSDDLEAALIAVTDAGGIVTKQIFNFPGGRRFQFTEPGGNEMAVWSEI